MGYYVSGRGPAVIPAGEMAAALETARMVMLDDAFIRQHAGGGSFGAEGQRTWWYSWTDMTRLREAESIVDWLEEFGFEVELDEDGGIEYLDYPESKSGQEDLLLSVLAPHFAPGSHIEWEGEDGDRWKTDLHADELLRGRVVYEESS